MTNYDLFYQKMVEMGMEAKVAKGYCAKFQKDEKFFPVDDMKVKEWAIKRGFYPGNVDYFGLNEDNYQYYLPDFYYFMMHPLNNHFRIWLGDKLTTKYVLNGSGCEDMMPDYYVYVENDGSFTYLMDCPSDINKDESFLLNLLKRHGILAMKPNSGTSGGHGFIKLEYKDGEIYENNELITMEQFHELQNSMRNYIITEWCYQHHDLAKVWSDSECALRVIMYKKVKKNPFAASEWKCALCYARFGTELSGGTCNVSSGGVGVPFNFETGEYDDFSVRFKWFTQDGQIKQYCHPDTNYIWKGNKLPNWEKVKEGTYRICQHIDSLDYLGFDIIITDDSMKICEINTKPSMTLPQFMQGPVLTDEDAKAFFDSKMKKEIDCNKLWEAYLQCQE